MLSTLRARVLTAMVTSLVLAAAGVGALLALHHSPPHTTPSLYTNQNSADVWVHPARHLGARVDVQGTLGKVTRLGGTSVAVVVIDNHPVAVHIFDPHFSASSGASVRIVGSVRGALGGDDGLAGQAPRTGLAMGTIIVDAQALSSLDGSPVSASGSGTGCAAGAHRKRAQQRGCAVGTLAAALGPAVGGHP